MVLKTSGNIAEVCAEQVPRNNCFGGPGTPKGPSEARHGVHHRHGGDGWRLPSARADSSRQPGRPCRPTSLGRLPPSAGGPVAPRGLGLPRAQGEALRPDAAGGHCQRPRRVGVLSANYMHAAGDKFRCRPSTRGALSAARERAGPHAPGWHLPPSLGDTAAQTGRASAPSRQGAQLPPSVTGAPAADQAGPCLPRPPGRSVCRPPTAPAARRPEMAYK
ncbi:cuticle collagen 2-like [Jatropha curcas]|uniref:cuticle collagen 2-like n=1 Tax=Jatropha curcas TaxID=180498 RepID=UPI0018947CF7|nr:cuticle collagen 2-like [Jatropha curcas]